MKVIVKLIGLTALFVLPLLAYATDVIINGIRKDIQDITPEEWGVSPEQVEMSKIPDLPLKTRCFAPTHNVLADYLIQDRFGNAGLRNGKAQNRYTDKPLESLGSIVPDTSSKAISGLYGSVDGSQYMYPDEKSRAYVYVTWLKSTNPRYPVSRNPKERLQCSLRGAEQDNE
jgi:hypothetical protein